VECGRQIDCEDLVPFLDRKLVERCDVLNTGIVDENVEPTKVSSVAAIISAIASGDVISAAE
jgi:hypothetical protein